MPPRQFTDPGGQENGANDVLEVVTDMKDLVVVQRKVSNALNPVQDLLLDLFHTMSGQLDTGHRYGSNGVSGLLVNAQDPSFVHKML